MALAVHSPSASDSASTSTSTNYCVNIVEPQPLKNGFTNGCSMGESNCEITETSMAPLIKSSVNENPTKVLKKKPREIGTSQNGANEQLVADSSHARTSPKTEVQEHVICRKLTVQNVVDSSPTTPQGEVHVNSSSQPPTTTEPTETAPIKIEIVKSILYGGLTELIASLGIVASAATTEATTGKIVSLSLASLITGVFVFAYKMSDLWTNEKQTGSNEPDDENVDQYEKLFGDRKNYGVHFTMAILSFVLFGLVPPLVYGFTFCKAEDKNLKIPTVTIATILCIALLGAIKAYIEKEKNKNCVGYINTIGKFIVDALGTAVLTTIGGDIIGNYIEKFGWFEPNKIPTLLLPSMSFDQNRNWGAF